MIQAFPDVEALAHSVAELLCDRARESVRERGQFSLVLSGGQTPRRLYGLLAGEEFRGQLPWSRTHVFWGDERCVPPGDARSNELMVREALLNHVPIPPSHIHPMRCSQPPGASATQYESDLRVFFVGKEPQFDLVLLGLGENGHTASLFPHTPAVGERDRWVVDLYVEDQGFHRLTLTAPLINRARMIVFLVTGRSKARVLREVLEGPSEPQNLPAQLIRPASGELLWCVDREAAALLRNPAS
jgi:6-phosphogluconolactonase